MTRFINLPWCACSNVSAIRLIGRVSTKGPNWIRPSKYISSTPGEVAPFLRTEFVAFLNEPSEVTSYLRGGLPEVAYC
jgi:hypothetical protein